MKAYHLHEHVSKIQEKGVKKERWIVMNRKKISYGAALLLLIGVLPACGKQQQAGFKQAFTEEFDKSFRSEFIASFTQKCMENAPKEAGIPAETLQKFCTCAAEKGVEVIKPDDVVKLMKGDQEIEARVMAAGAGCWQILGVAPAK